MKSIVTQSVIEGIRAKKDRSLSLTISTPELSVQEEATFMYVSEIVNTKFNWLMTALDPPLKKCSFNLSLALRRLWCIDGLT